MNPGHHTYEMTPLALLLHFKLRTVIFSLKQNFLCIIICRHVCLHFMCTWCPQHPEEDADSLELELQMAVIHHGAENQGRVLWKSSQKYRAVFPALTLTSYLLTYLVYNLKLRAVLLWYLGNRKEKWKIQG